MYGRGEPVYFWAEGGLVHWEDGRETLPVEKRYGVMSWIDAAKRRIGLVEMMPTSSENGGKNWRHERAQLQKFMCDLERVIQMAKEQVPPDSQDAAAERRRRRPVSVIVPQIVNMD
jgi:hypothetical protein